MFHWDINGSFGFPIFFDRSGRDTHRAATHDDGDPGSLWGCADVRRKRSGGGPYDLGVGGPGWSCFSSPKRSKKLRKITDNSKSTWKIEKWAKIHERSTKQRWLFHHTLKEKVCTFQRFFQKDLRGWLTTKTCRPQVALAPLRPLEAAESGVFHTFRFVSFKMFQDGDQWGRDGSQSISKTSKLMIGSWLFTTHRIQVGYIFLSRLWFQIFFMFTLNMGEDEPMLTHIFAKGFGESTN